MDIDNFMVLNNEEHYDFRSAAAVEGRETNWEKVTWSSAYVDPPHFERLNADIHELLAMP